MASTADEPSTPHLNTSRTTRCRTSWLLDGSSPCQSGFTQTRAPMSQGEGFRMHGGIGGVDHVSSLRALMMCVNVACRKRFRCSRHIPSNRVKFVNGIFSSATAGTEHGKRHGHKQSNRTNMQFSNSLSMHFWRSCVPHTL